MENIFKNLHKNKYENKNTSTLSDFKSSVFLKNALIVGI